MPMLPSSNLKNFQEKYETRSSNLTQKLNLYIREINDELLKIYSLTLFRLGFLGLRKAGGGLFVPPSINPEVQMVET